MDAEERALIEAYDKAGQGHVFRFLDDLDAAGRKALLEQARGIDLLEIDTLYRNLVAAESRNGGDDFSKLKPAPYIALPEHGGDADLWQQAGKRGEEALRDGKVATFTVAGGQGTRLGYPGPKGTYPVSPVRKASLFQLFAEKILAAGRRYGHPVRWYVMTSHLNHEDTQAFFTSHGYFGLAAENITLFRQGLMPAVDADGRILMQQPGVIAMSPDGHGGSLRALVRSGATADMRSHGVEVLSYFQVDNPLVRCVDPFFIGHHLLSGGDMTSKMVPKANSGEKVGHFCLHGGKPVVVEYSDMPGHLTQLKDASGKLTFNSGSIAIHVLGIDFVERVGGSGGRSLPFHRADKKIPCIDADGKHVEPVEANGVKFEMFVFDALPLAHDPVIVETRREEDFSPVKNATGVDSAETCRRDQLRQYARWACAAGADVPVDRDGVPAYAFEITPLYADSAATLAKLWQDKTTRPTLRAGLVLDDT